MQTISQVQEELKPEEKNANFISLDCTISLYVTRMMRAFGFGENSANVKYAKKIDGQSAGKHNTHAIVNTQLVYENTITSL